jgi:hypothetical protein
MVKARAGNGAGVDRGAQSPESQGPTDFLAQLSDEDRREAVAAFRGLMSILREWDREVPRRNVDGDC